MQLCNLSPEFFLPKRKFDLSDSVQCLIDIFILENSQVSMDNKIPRCLLQPSYAQASWTDKSWMESQGGRRVCPRLMGSGHSQKDSIILSVMTYSLVVLACCFLPK